MKPCENKGFCARNAPGNPPEGVQKAGDPYNTLRKLFSLWRRCIRESEKSPIYKISPLLAAQAPDHDLLAFGGVGGVGGGLSGLRGYGGWGVGGWVYERPGRAPAGGPPPPNQWLDQ